jgi:hypothetical protein
MMTRMKRRGKEVSIWMKNRERLIIYHWMSIKSKGLSRAKALGKTSERISLDI